MAYRKDAIWCHATALPQRSDKFFLRSLQEQKLNEFLNNFFNTQVATVHFPSFGNAGFCCIVKLKREVWRIGERFMHLLWGMKCMAGVKWMALVPYETDISDETAFFEWMLNHLDLRKQLFVFRANPFDVYSRRLGYAFRVGIDFCLSAVETVSVKSEKVIIREEWIDKELAMLDRAITGCKACGLDSSNPLLLIRVDKRNQPDIAKVLNNRIFDKINLKGFKVFILVDESCRDLSELDYLLWCFVTGVSANQDFYYRDDRVLVDATLKEELSLSSQTGWHSIYKFDK
jgi:3-polyprenyl-4-hydroxybenzoate decarboxylase